MNEWTNMRTNERINEWVNRRIQNWSLNVPINLFNRAITSWNFDQQRHVFDLRKKGFPPATFTDYVRMLHFLPENLEAFPFRFAVSTIQKLWVHPWIFVFLECPIKTHSECWKSSIVSAFPITTSNLFQFLPLPFYNVQYPPGYHDLVLSLWICGVPWWMIFVGCLRCTRRLRSCWWSGSHRFGFSICSGLRKHMARRPEK